MARVLGIDFGGTKILAAVVDTGTGEVLSHAKKRTHSDNGVDDVVSRLTEVMDRALSDAGRGDVERVGVGVAGQVDHAKNELVRAPNLPEALLGSAITDTIRDHVGKPASLYNDVAAAAAGEAAFGAGRGHPDFVCVFAGTGIGGAIYEHGKPVAGATNTAGELGHMVIDFGGRICGCGGRGHLEAYASRSAIVRSVLSALKQGRQSTLRDLAPDPNPDDVAHTQIRSRALALAITAGDRLATAMVEEGARYMGAGLVSIINFYNPPRIILGGGIVDAVDLYFDVAEQVAREEALVVPRQNVEIVKTSLGDYSGVVGAAVLTG